MRIKDKGGLKKTLRQENYDNIAIWASGEWADVGTGYDGEQDGNNPEVYILRSHNYNLTFREINTLVTKKEAAVNRYI